MAFSETPDRVLTVINPDHFQNQNYQGDKFAISQSLKSDTISSFKTNPDKALTSYSFDVSDQQFYPSDQQIAFSVQNNVLTSQDIHSDRMPDWYFISIIIVLTGLIWIRILYNKFLTALFENSVNYFMASKSFKEQNIVQKRFGLVLDLFYLINSSLFILLLSRHYKWDLPISGDLNLLLASFGILLSLMIIRIIVMKAIGNIFNRINIFSEYLFHHFLFSKILSVILIPFLVSIPYTEGILHEALILCALILVGIVYLMRIVRVIIFTIKNAFLLFYLILYLCTLEIIPLLVFIKIILSLR